MSNRLSCSFGVPMSSNHRFNPISTTGHSLYAWAHQPRLHALAVFPKDLSVGHYTFSIYTSSLSTITESHDLIMSFNSSTQMTRSYMSTCHYLTITATHHTRVNLLRSLHVWFCENVMVLNPTKSDAIFFGTFQRLKPCLALPLLI